MKFGISLQSRGPAASPENLALAAGTADDLGFYSAFIGDHVVIPHSIASEYPYRATGAFTGSASGECLETLTTLTFVSALTKRIRIAPGVLILPHRNPVVTAKILASMDVLSKGRLIVGVGVGWLEEEFDALGLPPFAERGAVGNEYLRVFKELWTQENPSFDGKYAKFSDIIFEPKPVQKPHPPIWVGGESPPALRRAAALGDAWHPIGSNPRFPLVTAGQLKASVDRLTGYAEGLGRDPSEIEVAYRTPAYRLSNAGDRDRPFTGNAEQIIADIRDFAEAGAGHLVFDFRSENTTQTVETMQRFAEEIMPQASGL